MSKYAFDRSDFRNLNDISSDLLVGWGCYPLQDAKEAFRILRRKYILASDAWKLAKWISTTKRWPETIVTMFSAKLLSLPSPEGIEAYFAKTLLQPQKISPSIRFRRYESLVDEDYMWCMKCGTRLEFRKNGRIRMLTDDCEFYSCECGKTWYPTKEYEIQRLNA